jgi:hypothetical protein
MARYASFILAILLRIHDAKTYWKHAMNNEPCGAVMFILASAGMYANDLTGILESK